MAKIFGIAAPAVVALSLATAMLVAGCDLFGLRSEGNGQTGSLSLTMAGMPAGSRSVVADPSQIAIDSYSIILESHDGHPTRKLSSSAYSITVSDLELGTWDIKVHAMQGSSIVAYGEALHQVVSASAPISVTINLSMTQDGTGGFSLPITFPASTGIDYVCGTLSKLDGTVVGSPLVPTITTVGDEKSCVLSMNAVPSGAYLFSMDFRRGGEAGTPAGVFGEAVNIWDNVVSDRWVDPSTGTLISHRVLSESEFFSGNSRLAVLSISSQGSAIPLDPLYSSGTTNYTVAERSRTAVSIALLAQKSVAGQNLSYRISSGTWSSLSDGLAQTLIAEFGDTTIEVLVTAPDGVSQKVYSINLTTNPAYIVEYHGNGASGGDVPVDANQYLEGDSAIVSAPDGLHRNDYSFAGWNTLADGSSDTLLPGDGIIVDGGDVHLYANWNYTTAVWASGVRSGSNDTLFKSVAVDESGNAYIAGTILGAEVYDFGNGVSVQGAYWGYNLCLVKYDVAGKAQWARSVVSASGYSGFDSLAVAPDGSIYVVGDLWEGNGLYEFGNDVSIETMPCSIILKYDSSGNAIWVRAYYASDLNKAAVAPDGGIVVAAESGILKYDSAGNILWSRGGAVATTGSGLFSQDVLHIGGDGSIFTGGGLWSYGYTSFGLGNDVNVDWASTRFAFFVAKYDSMGIAQWVRRQASTSGSSVVHGIATDAAGNVFLAGELRTSDTYDFGNGVSASGTCVDLNGVLVKYDSDGTPQWARSISGPQVRSCFNGVSVDSGGDVLVVGGINGSGTFEFGGEVKAFAFIPPNFGSTLLLKCDTSGVIQWAQTSLLGTSASASFSSLAIDNADTISTVGRMMAGSALVLGEGVGIDLTSGGTDNLVLVRYENR